MTSPKIFVASLASYNNGATHGEWIDAAKDWEDLAMEVKVVVESAQHKGEEYIILDCEGFGEYNVRQFDALEQIAAVAQGIKEHGQIFGALVNNFCGDVGEATTAIEECYHGSYNSLEEYAESYLEDVGMFDGCKNELRNYFDFERYANDLVLGGDIYTIEYDGEVHVFISL